MSNSNWNNKITTPNRPDNHGPLTAAPAAVATETELEAIRYRGAPLHRTAPLVAPQHNYVSNAAPGGHNERIQAINEADVWQLSIPARFIIDGSGGLAARRSNWRPKTTFSQ